MNFNRRGATHTGVYITGVLIWVALILMVVIVSLSYFNQTGVDLGVLEGLPDGVQTMYDTVLSIATPIVSGLFWVVAPAGEGENVQMIAFAIFLLLTLIGTKTLSSFIKGPYLAFIISAIVGVIAGRSLTAFVLQETALGASPIAAVSLLLGFLPIFALTKNIDSWGLTQWSKMVVFTVAGVVYFFVFFLAFNSPSLGITYGAGIVLLGAGQLIAPYWKKTKKQRENQGLGRYMAGVQETVSTVKQMQQGSQQA